MKKIFKTGLLLLLITIVCIGTLKAQYIQYTNRSLFSDFKAVREGDAIMVLIVEDTQANNTATSDESRSTNLTAGANASTGTGTSFNGTVGLNTGNTFKANGQTTRNETIRSKISARVIEVEDNGNLRIEGTRTTKVNGETQKIVIKGIVRPVDVMTNNSVYSYNILDLTLLIDGDGTVTKVQEPGLITKFLRFLF